MIWRRILFWASLIAIASAFPVLVILLRQSDELGSKPEASFLQALEVQNRATPVDSHLIVKHRDEYCAVGIPAGDGKRWVWVLLNPKYRPYEKEMPAGQDYQISAHDLDWLKEQCTIADPVGRLLERHVR